MWLQNSKPGRKRKDEPAKNWRLIVISESGSGRFLLADQGYLNIFPAVGANQSDGNRLFHNSFSHSGQNGVYVIQTVIHYFDTLFQSLQFVDFFRAGPGFIFICQNSTSA